MEGEGEPPEITNLIRDLRTTADDFVGTGEWLANAMQASWDVAAVLIDIDGLADVLGERHRIIANGWLAADVSAFIARLLHRAADILDHIDFIPAAVRVDLAGPRHFVGSCTPLQSSSIVQPTLPAPPPALSTTTSAAGASSASVQDIVGEARLDPD